MREAAGYERQNQFLRRCTLFVTYHAKQRYMQRVGCDHELSAEANIVNDIRKGSRCGKRRRKKWKALLGFLNEENNGTFVESVDAKRLYVCRWSSDGLHVCTVLVADANDRSIGD